MNTVSIWHSNEKLRPLREFLGSSPESRFSHPALSNYANSKSFSDLVLESDYLEEKDRERNRAYFHQVREFETQILIRICPDLLEKVPLDHPELDKPWTIDLEQGFEFSFPWSRNDKHVSDHYLLVLAHYILFRDRQVGLLRGDIVGHDWYGYRNTGLSICSERGLEDLDYRVHDYGMLPVTYLCPTQFPFDYWEGVLGYNDTLVHLDLKPFRNQIYSNLKHNLRENESYNLPLIWQGEIFYLTYYEDDIHLITNRDFLTVEVRKREGVILLTIDESNLDHMKS